jgi:hypothetical protein
MLSQITERALPEYSLFIGTIGWSVPTPGGSFGMSGPPNGGRSIDEPKKYAKDAPTLKSLRMKRTLDVSLDEDLWLEMAFYPNRPSMMKIIRQLRHDKEFKAGARELNRLVSRRIHGYQGAMALALLQKI